MPDRDDCHGSEFRDVSRFSASVTGHYSSNRLGIALRSRMVAGSFCLPLRDRLWIVLLAALAACQIVVSLLLKQGQTLTNISDLIQGALLLIATAAFVPNCLRSRTSVRRTRHFWILMSAGMCLWTIYQGIWISFEVVRRQEVPDPFLGDIVLFLHLVPMMAALALLPHLGEDDRDERLRILDFALLLIWWVFLYVYTVIPWQTVYVDELAYSTKLNVTYLTEKLVMLVALVFLTYDAQGGWRYFYANLLGASALYASSSYVAIYAIAHGEYYSGSVYDIPLIFSMAWMAALGNFAPRFHTVEVRPSQPLLGIWITRLGMLALFSLPCLAIYAQLKADSPPVVRDFRSVLSLFTMIVMGALVFLRQKLLGIELASLLERSRSSFEDLKTLQSQLIQSEKLASLGQLVGGAAHEINNPLTAMLGYSDLLNLSTLPPAERTLADRIASQVRHTRTLVASLLTFVRQAPAKLSGIDINSIVQTAMRLIGPQIEAQGGQVELQLGSSLPPVLADSNQFLHVCLHLAGQISNQTDGGRGLSVRTWTEDGRVSVEFSRTGAAADHPFDVLDRSTKAQPVSLSLGACCRIVEEHGGLILTQQNEAVCHSFRVELPAAQKSTRPLPLQARPNSAVAGSGN